MKYNKYLILALLTLYIYACHSNKKSEEKNSNALVNNDSIEPKRIVENVTMSFLDSIKMKYEILKSQIKEHTLIDSMYYTGMYSEAHFEGDSLLENGAGFKIAIVKYDDRIVCTYKFLLVYDQMTLKNIDLITILSDCDRDFSADYYMDDYRFLNDSTFEIIETFIPAESEESSPKTIKRRKVWKITEKGKLQLYGE